MGEIRKRERRGRVVYLARHYSPEGRKVSKQFDTKREAADWLTEVGHSMLTGNYLDPNRGKIKAGVWADQWLAGQGHLKPTTRAKYAGIVERHVKPRFGTTPLNRITYDDASAWVSGLTGPTGNRLSPGAVRYIHRVLFLILEHAVKDGRIARNPAAGVKLPRLPRVERRFLTREQVFDLADAAARYPVPEVGEQYRVMILLLAHTGLRWGEASGLRVKRLDLLRRRITVAETLVEVGGRLQASTPKNHQQRQVPIPGWLAEELAVVVAEKDPDDLVFATWHGRPLRNLNFRRDVFNRAAVDAGLGEWVEGPKRPLYRGVSPHELRHTAASLAAKAGARVSAVQKMLGHSSAKMTLDTYTHLFDDELEGVAERFAAPPPRHQAGTGTDGADVVDLDKRRPTR